MAWNENEWQTGSGLPDNYIFKVNESYFTTRSSNYGTQTVLVWAGERIDDDGAAHEHTLMMGCGKGWVPDNNGKQLVSDGAKVINNGTHFGKVIERIRLGKLGEEIKDFLGSKGTGPREASTWVGLNWRMKREEQTTGKGEDVRTFVQELPVEWIVEGKGQQAKAAVNVPVAQTATAPSSNGNGSNGAHSSSNSNNPSDIILAGVDQKVVGLLKAFAKTSGDRDTFETKCLGNDAILSNSDVVAHVIDPSGTLFAALKG